MKNKTLVILATIYILVLMISIANADERLKIGSNRLGTSFYVQGATVADVISKYAGGIDVEAMPIAGAVANIKLIEDKKTLDIALTMNINAMAAMRGMCGFKKSTEMRSLVGNMDRYYIGIMARKDLPYNSLAEIVQKKAKIRLYTQAKGSTAEMLASQLLESVGATYDDIKNWGGSVSFTDTENITNAFKDGYCDVFVLNVNKGHPVITEIALSGKLKFVPLSEEQQKFMQDKYGFVPDNLPANTFKYQDKKIPTGGSSTMIIVPASMNDEIAYKITKAVVEHKIDLIKGHKAFNDFNTKDAANSKFLGEVPLHPGAIKYYKEVGQIK